MEKIGIIGAMPEEVLLLKNRMSGVSIEKVAGLEIYCGEMHGKKVCLCQSGMGKVARGAATQVLCLKYGIDKMIFSGIAGNMTAKIGVGDVCLGKEVMYHDADLRMIAQHYPNLTSYKGDEGLLEAAGRACREIGANYIEGKIATGDQFVGDSRTKNKIRDFCAPDCVEMEGAAVAHIAAKNDVPCLVIRSMSDNADEAATEKLIVKQFDISEYADHAAKICELTVKYC